MSASAELSSGSPVCPPANTGETAPKERNLQKTHRFANTRKTDVFFLPSGDSAAACDGAVIEAVMTRTAFCTRQGSEEWIFCALWWNFPTFVGRS